MPNGALKRVRNDKEVCEDVERLKEWLLKQRHLPHNIDDSFLKVFVCGTKTLEIAKQKLDAWFVYRGTLQNMFSLENRNPFSPKFRRHNTSFKFFYLPNATPEGYRVFMVSATEDVESYSINHEATKLCMMLEVAMDMWPDMSGVLIVVDFHGILKRMPKMTPTTCATFLHWFQTCVPMRLKNILLINSTSGVTLFLNTLVKPFLSTKLYNKIVVTTEKNIFLKTILPEDMIPEDYGGNTKSSEILNDEWNKRLEERAEWFKDISSLVSDEKKRLPDQNNTYGVDGTFRVLNVD